MKTALAAAAGALLLASAAHAASPSPFDGTWRIDMSSVAFSKKPSVWVIKDGVQTNSTSTPPYSVKADGAFHAVTGHPGFDAAMVKVVDARTVDEAYRKGGREVSSDRETISPDGKTLTVDWKDMTNAGAPVTSGQAVLTRVSAAPAGAHAVSGGFVTAKADASADAVTWTMKVEGDALSYSNPTGQAYTARIGGGSAPYKGDPGVTTVKVARGGAHELVETDYHDGKAVSTMRMTLSPDGRTMSLVNDDLKSGRQSSAKATKL